jgi:opine dehydrogenase
MTVGIAGAGSIAMAYAAFLASEGHDPSLWSPSGRRTLALSQGEPLITTRAIEGSFQPHVSASLDDLVEADVIALALPAYGRCKR